MAALRQEEIPGLQISVEDVKVVDILQGENGLSGQARRKCGLASLEAHGAWVNHLTT